MNVSYRQAKRIHKRWQQNGMGGLGHLNRGRTVDHTPSPEMAAFGAKAVENSFEVTFFRLEELLAALRRDADLSPARLRRKKHLNTGLLIIDEMGFEPMSRQEASLFFRLVSHRYEWGSILITTNMGIKDWPELLSGDEVLATAILDRLLHRGHVLNIKGRSYRLREPERAAATAG